MTYTAGELVLGLDTSSLYVLGASQSLLMMAMVAGSILAVRALARKAARAI